MILEAALLYDRGGLQVEVDPVEVTSSQGAPSPCQEESAMASDPRPATEAKPATFPRHEAANGNHLLPASDAAPTTAGQVVDGMEVPPSSPMMARSTAQYTAAGPQPEAADGTATGGAPATTVLSAEDTPTPREAAKRLARFSEEVLLMRQPPLINSPPKQKPPPTRTLLLRSRRIAAQQLDHVSASKRGGELLMKKMGFLAPSAPSSSDRVPLWPSVRTTPTLRAPFGCKLEALDELFPACTAMTGGAARRPSTVAP
jgi:hypothetical protein